MPLVRVLRSRGTTITVEAHGEVLFQPGAPLSEFNRKFSRRLRSFSRSFAPTNKRPRWDHYGKPLKATMRASTQNNPALMEAYSAVGSTAPHAYYVDQGTGIYNGSGPYLAKVLPPWTQGSPSLYESGWKPNPRNNNRTVGAVVIRGQKGQQFFKRALEATFASFGMAHYSRPGGLGTYPQGLANFKGNTPNDAAFQSSLQEWRDWRDDAWHYGGSLGRGNDRKVRRVRDRRVSDEQKRANRDRRRRASRKYSGVPETDVERERRLRFQSERQKRYQAKNRDAIKRRRYEREKEKADRRDLGRNAEKTRFLAAARAKYGSKVVERSLRFDEKENRWYVTIRERQGKYIKTEMEIRGREVK